jgi:hypothetical protein
MKICGTFAANCRASSGEQQRPPSRARAGRTVVLLSSSASRIGVAIASPTTMSMLAFWSWMSCSAPCPEYLRIRTTLPPLQNVMKLLSSAAPCMSGAAGKLVMPPARAFSPASSGVLTAPPQGTPPPMPAKNRSSWRHMTPLGMPVVPPV